MGIEEMRRRYDEIESLFAEAYAEFGSSVGGFKTKTDDALSRLRRITTELSATELTVDERNYAHHRGLAVLAFYEINQQRIIDARDSLQLLMSAIKDLKS